MSLIPFAAIAFVSQGISIGGNSPFGQLGYRFGRKLFYSYKWNRGKNIIVLEVKTKSFAIDVFFKESEIK